MASFLFRTNEAFSNYRSPNRKYSGEAQNPCSGKTYVRTFSYCGLIQVCEAYFDVPVLKLLTKRRISLDNLGTSFRTMIWFDPPNTTNLAPGIAALVFKPYSRGRIVSFFPWITSTGILIFGKKDSRSNLYAALNESKKLRNPVFLMSAMHLGIFQSPECGNFL